MGVSIKGVAGQRCYSRADMGRDYSWLRFSVSAVLGCGGVLPPPVVTTAVPPDVTQLAAAKPQPITRVALADIGLDAAKLDKSADPCDDFYRFACGAWLDHTEIPADKSSYSMFSLVADRNEALLHDILESAAKAPDADPVLQQLGAFYGACMDEPAVERADTAGLVPLFAATRKIKDDRTLLEAIAFLQRAGIDGLFTLVRTQDRSDATRTIAQIEQSGLGLPDRAHYLDDDETMLKRRAAYLAHVERLFVLVGKTPAAAKRAAADTLAIETANANSQMAPVELRDQEATHNPLDRAALVQLAPLAWDSYFATLGFPDIASINTVSRQYVEAFARLVHAFSSDAWRNYLDARILSVMAPYLPQRFVAEAFEINRLLTGQKSQKPRWKRCIRYTDESLSELVAQPYVAAAFGGASRQAAERMSAGVLRAFAANLPAVAWLDAATRSKAQTKLEQMSSLIGYPESFRRYDFAIDRTNFASSVLAAKRFETGYQLRRIGQPIDRREWLASPTIVNSFYDAHLNTMSFPAGILQPPLFDLKASTAVNYGAIGMLVGHEITHGFDDQGARYDGLGNLAAWWDKRVTEAFQQRTQCVADYYGQYEPLPGLKLNGQLTLGENVADMGGVKLAFAAYRSARAAAVSVQLADGFTEDQQFFLALGQAFCAKVSDELARTRLQVDEHASARFRVLGALSSLPEFAETWHCPVGAAMRPAHACQVW
jgi:predicted metalloendopeptidase